jgi:choline-sulfatase
MGKIWGELGMYAEHGTADNITCRIPMIIRWPGKGTKGHVDEGFHYNVDHLPTLADMLGVDHKSEWDGQSYAKSLTNKADTGRDDLILSQCCHGAQRSVRWDKWIYMRTYHDGYHLFPQEMLFDLEADPMELNNLADEKKEICQEGAWRLMNWHDEMMQTQPYGYHDDPLWQVVKEVPQHARYDLEKYCKRLEATGRGDSAVKLRKKYPEML